MFSDIRIGMEYGYRLGVAFFVSFSVVLMNDTDRFVRRSLVPGYNPSLNRALHREGTMHGDVR